MENENFKPRRRSKRSEEIKNIYNEVRREFYYGTYGGELTKKEAREETREFRAEVRKRINATKKRSIIPKETKKALFSRAKKKKKKIESDSESDSESE